MSQTAPAPQPGGARLSSSSQDSFFELLSETLEQLDPPVRGQFLQRFLRAIAHVEMTEQESLDCWEQILERRQELSERLGERVSLRTAMLEVLASTEFLRVPILVEYDELKKLRVNAATDALTGLYNRRLFEEYFEKELNRARRYGHPMVLVILDLHQFKQVNDRHGHPRGDHLLQIVGATLRKTLRASDYAFRIGGDEFAVLLPESDSEQASALTKRVQSQYEIEIQPLKLEVPTSLDYGISVYPQDGEQKEDLLRVADERLYEFKGAVRAQLRPVPTPVPPPSAQPATPPLGPQPMPFPPTTPTVPPIRPGAEHRRWERVSLAGTNAYAILSEGRERTARVIDLSYGGVALEVDRPEELPSQFAAVLHVPILPPVRVSLRKVYALQRPSGPGRVGCSFVS